MKNKSKSSSRIADNKRAKHDYFIEEHFEAGIVLQGWEVKSVRSGKFNIGESYVLLKYGEAFLLGSQITPLLSASTHVNAENLRTRKLLLHRKEINRLIGLVDRSGYTVIPVNAYWKQGRVKVQIGLAKGKKEHDKRETIKRREWNIEKGRLFKNHV